MKIKELKERRSEIEASLNHLADTIENEGRTFSEEEKVSFDSWRSEQATINEQIDKLERIDSIRSLTKPQPKVEFSSTVGADDYGLAFKGWLQAGIQGETVDARCHQAMNRCGWDRNERSFVSFQQSTSASEGGNVLDGSLFQGVITRMKETGNLLSESNVIYTDDDTPIHFVQVDDTGNGMSLVSELSDVSNASVSTPKVTLNSYQYASGVFPISRQLVRMRNFNLIDYFAGLLGGRAGRGMDSVWSVADGSSKPQGLVTGLSAGVTAAADDAITWAELVDLVDSVDSSYHNGAKFYMTRPTYSYFLKQYTGISGDKTPLYRESYALGAPATLLGFPVVFLPAMAAIGAGTAPIVFANVREAFTIRIVGNLSIAQSNELYWKSQAIALAAWMYTDSKVTNANAGKKLVMAAE